MWYKLFPIEGCLVLKLTLWIDMVDTKSNFKPVDFIFSSLFLNRFESINIAILKHEIVTIYFVIF